MIDAYTKWMLTVIALALTVIAAGELLHGARAQIGFSRVQICDVQNCAQLFPIQTSVQGRQVTLWALPIVRGN